VRFGVKAVAKTVNDSDGATKVTKGRKGRPEEPIKPKKEKKEKTEKTVKVGEKQRKNVLKRSDVKQVRKEKIKPVKKQWLPKQVAIQANAKDVYVLTKAQSEKRIADRKKHIKRLMRRTEEERKKKKSILEKQKAILAKRAALVSGVKKSKHKKIRTTPHFRRPKTLRLPKAPKYPRKSVPSKPELNHYSIIKHPHVTESAMQAIENHHTLVFYC